MKKIIDGKLYNSNTATTLAERDHYNNGNYSGTTYLMVTGSGNVFCHTDSNGQDCFLTDDIYLPDSYDGLEPVDEAAEKKMIELGVITEA